MFVKYMAFLLMMLFIHHEIALMAIPAQIIVMRHAEKESVGHHINTKGKERAAALVPYFLERPEFIQFGPPIALFAHGVMNAGGSLRPIQTLTPLAKALGQKLQKQFLANQCADLAHYIMSKRSYDGRLVIIAWAHSYIPQIIAALGVPHPPKWPGENVFDRLWVITYHSNGEIEFEDRPQQLLFGDSPN